MASLLAVEQIECRYQQQVVVKQLSFAVEQGEVTCLLGPSGCGKTTVLRAIAGFNPIYNGHLNLSGCIISTPESNVPPEQRNIGMVFQDYALFPHLSVRDNIAFGLRQLGRNERHHTIEHLLKLVELKGMADRYPHELSGGQQQRVALARALAPKPKLLLMDEPFSNLDTELRRQLSVEVRDILKEEGISAIMVTHDQDEAFTVSDKLGILADGYLQQWGSPFEVYHHPANLKVAGFVGEGTFVRGRALEGGLVETDIGLVKGKATQWHQGVELDVFLRPHEIVPGCVDCSVQGEVVKREFLGTSTLYTLRLPNGRLVESSFVSADHDYRLGEQVGLRVETDNLVAFRTAV
ncbi:ABC transporter ATP-binding protein [Motiliproteus coralliicola]|uniref:ABC transporter ATP-binding protein n=1 Tax=Motiliproteus coralliicola TaxID=2283196 RepID=A0A369WMT6_9GAMM|nr:ABC transporter ATP-binding protein [Motiliproteus coralliicola]RDE22811.1 ABC transporter ATP-binding protein [Motiliproteus coralliicola]